MKENQNHQSSEGDDKILSCSKHVEEAIVDTDIENLESVNRTIDGEKVVGSIYQMRRNFLIIGLVGRTGSGCTSVADILKSEKITDYKSNYKKFNSTKIDNQTRKDRIVYEFLSQNWKPFTVIKASDIIFYYAMQLDFEKFKDALSRQSLSNSIDQANKNKGDKPVVEDNSSNENIKNAIDTLKDEYEHLREKIRECDDYINSNCFRSPAETDTDDKIDTYKKLVTEEIDSFRKKLVVKISGFSNNNLSSLLQKWGNDIRIYDTVDIPSKQCHENAPACLARKINQIIKMLRFANKKVGVPTLIVIDALRNPYEILYFRERYSAYYTMSVNTDKEIRHKKLFEKGYNIEEVKSIDKEESEKKELDERFKAIDVDKCIELSDIFLTHEGIEIVENHNLINQIYTYITLIFHPGLIPPSPLERIMQIAHTAKLNSGCLSRQVGAVVTNEYYSVQSIGWNTTAEGQTPCSLRCLEHLCERDDHVAFSKYEKTNKEFQSFIRSLWNKYVSKRTNLKGINVSYCFKDIFTTINKKKQKGNQVHTRSLHAEENAFLQLAKYGSAGIRGGKLFTTASCCELCGKKAYQLGIKEIYYIDTYPGITKDHILDCGDNIPKLILFHGAIGRAYIELYDQLMPIKDEIQALTNVRVKDINNPEPDKGTREVENYKEDSNSDIDGCNNNN